MDKEKNNVEVSSDAMIMDNRKSARMQKANSFMKIMCVRNIIKYIGIERRVEGSSCCILFFLSIISECYLLCSKQFVFFQ